MDNAIVKYLEDSGCTEIRFDGAWVVFVTREGKSSYASRAELRHEMNGYRR